jgi:anthranilate phosphoribosyltransferase
MSILQNYPDINNITVEQFVKIFDDIFNNHYTKAQVSHFLLHLNFIDLPVNAIFGAINSLQKQAIKPSINPHLTNQLIDICGTGGDKLNTLNISTAVAFVLAGAGIKVAKHGNKAISSQSGSADIFSQLKLSFTTSAKIIEEMLLETNLCFIYAPYFHPILAKIADVRAEINQPTIFNFLGPLLNPLQPPYQLIGVAKHSIANKMLHIIANNQQHQAVSIVSAHNGLDEISNTCHSFLWQYQKPNILPCQTINPQDLGFRLVDLAQIQGKDSVYNAFALLKLLAGEHSAYRDIVVLNAIYALLVIKPKLDFQEAKEIIIESLDNKKAQLVLQKLQKL